MIHLGRRWASSLSFIVMLKFKKLFLQSDSDGIITKLLVDPVKCNFREDSTDSVWQWLASNLESWCIDEFCFIRISVIDVGGCPQHVCYVGVWAVIKLDDCRSNYIFCPFLWWSSPAFFIQVNTFLLYSLPVVSNSCSKGSVVGAIDPIPGCWWQAGDPDRSCIVDYWEILRCNQLEKLDMYLILFIVWLDFCKA